MIESIFGPMFAGKTSELMRKIKRHRLAGKKCVVINFLNDNRYSLEDKIVSHDQISISAIKCIKLEDIPNDVIEASEVIGIDEGQFFPDLCSKANKWANSGKVVLIAALDCTYQMKPFNHVTDLLAISENVTKLTAVCMDCGKDAAFTKRTTRDSQIQLIGGLDMYKPVCRKCFNSLPEYMTPKKAKVATSNINKFNSCDIKDKEKLFEEMLNIQDTIKNK